jgi:hypothetical protein
MLNFYPRLPASSADGDDGSGDAVDAYRVFYSIGVVCITIAIFCALVASSSVAVWKACAFAAMAALLLGVVGRFAPRTTWLRGRGRPASALLSLTATSGRTRAPGCACVLPTTVPLPPAYPYVCPLESDGGAAASCVMCSVCLEDVHSGEMVRRLPACRHIFHVDCVDMWLQSHRTCPMCRSVIAPPVMLTIKAAATEEAPESSDESLPPV